MSFVVSAVPYDLSVTLYCPLIGGGPVAIIWGWVAVCLVALCQGVSLGEITSVYPTSGGVYYQTYMLSPIWCRRITAWICGWAYILGNITITLVTNFGTTQFSLACINVFTDKEANAVWSAEKYEIFLVFIAITILCNVVSSCMNRWLPMLDTFTVFWTLAGVTCIVVCVLSIANSGRNSASYVFGEFKVSSGWNSVWSFFIGLLHRAYATSATGMILSMCEEVQQPAIQVPKAMVGTIILNTICGAIFLINLVFVVPPIEDVVLQESPLPYILTKAIGHNGGAFTLTVPILILALAAGIGCTTATSRCIWAFARDGEIPGSEWWKLVKLWTFHSTPWYSARLSKSYSELYHSAQMLPFRLLVASALSFCYTMPVLASLLGGRQKIIDEYWNLGLLGAFCNVVTIGWCLLAIPLFCMPSTLPTTRQTMNYAAVVFIGGGFVSVVWYFAHGRRSYKGPPI